MLRYFFWRYFPRPITRWCSYWLGHETWWYRYQLWARTRRHTCETCARKVWFWQFLDDERQMCHDCWDEVPAGGPKDPSYWEPDCPLEDWQVPA
jgi:hypothetical protein